MGNAATTVKLDPYDPAWPLRSAVARDELVRMAIFSRLEELGHDCVATSFADDPHHAFFSRTVDGARTEHLHVMTLGRESMVGHLLFRDFLRANPDVAVRYEREQRLARRFGDDRDDHVRPKMPVVEALMVQARRWKDRHAAPSD